MFYTIKPRTIVDFGEGVIPQANVTTVTNWAGYFERMNEGELIDNAPVFDHFSLQTTDYSRPETWEWILQDALTFTGPEISVNGWLVSDYFKQVLQHFIIAPSYRFYAANLKYRNNKLDYFIFNIQRPDLEKLFVFEKLKLGVTIGISGLPIAAYEGTVRKKQEFYDLRSRVLRTEKKYLTVSSVQVTQYFDFLPLWGLSHRIIISERLKTAIEQAKIEGVVIEPAPFEVIMPGLE